MSDVTAEPVIEEVSTEDSGGGLEEFLDERSVHGLVLRGE